MKTTRDRGLRRLAHVSGGIRAQLAASGELGEVYFRERAWDDHHDVYGYAKQE